MFEAKIKVMVEVQDIAIAIKVGQGDTNCQRYL
jgi:hypothetical protein